MSGAERIVEGTIVDVLPHALYRIAPAAGGGAIVAHLSDQARTEAVHLRPGRTVRVAVSAYDAGRGRILGRAEQGE